MPHVNANGCDFYYEQQGKGRDLVFIHGEIHGMEYWEHQVAEFSKDYRCLTYNRRGHAKTEWTEFGFSLVACLSRLVGSLNTTLLSSGG